MSFKERLGVLAHTKDRFIELKWKHAAVCIIVAWEFKLIHRIWHLNRKSHV